MSEYRAVGQRLTFSAAAQPSITQAKVVMLAAASGSPLGSRNGCSNRRSVSPGLGGGPSPLLVVRGLCLHGA
jgi:hypothetical protein